MSRKKRIFDGLRFGWATATTESRTGKVNDESRPDTSNFPNHDATDSIKEKLVRLTKALHRHNSEKATRRSLGIKTPKLEPTPLT
ncbi:MAG: hypothetical protein ACON4O_09885 [Lentimonas sp.]